MKVKELISELLKMPEDMEVVLSTYDGWGGQQEVEFVEIDTKEYELDSSNNKLPPVVKLS